MLYSSGPRRHREQSVVGEQGDAAF